MDELDIDYHDMTPEQRQAAKDKWDAELNEFEAIAAANGTAQVARKVSVEQKVSAIFKQNAPAAATEICNIALNSLNDRVRLDAAKYVTERVMGRIGDAKNIGDDGNPWDDIFTAVVKEPTAAERQRGSNVNIFRD